MKIVHYIYKYKSYEDDNGNGVDDSNDDNSSHGDGYNKMMIIVMMILISNVDGVVMNKIHFAFLIVYNYK